jgi:hypothetical protein
MTTISHTAQNLTAARFADVSVTDKQLRNTWGGGAMRHVVEQLGGQLVHIVTDAQTGHMQLDVRLVQVGYPISSNFEHVLVEYRWGTGDDEFNRTWYPLHNIGNIVVPDGRKGFDAVATHREERNAAYQKVLAEAVEANGFSRETAYVDGVVSVIQLSHRVDASWRPRSFRSNHKRVSRSFRPAELAS